MLQKLTDYISRRKGEWRSDFFKEPEQEWRSLLVLGLSAAAIYWGVSDYPESPTLRDKVVMLIGVFGGIAGLLGSVAELLPKSQTQLAGILRIWATLAALCIPPVVALQLLSHVWPY